MTTSIIPGRLPQRVTARERANKYHRATGKWTALPGIGECCRGNFREWMLDGTNYQSQLFCQHWRVFIAPSGATCAHCVARTWPEVENFRAHVLPPLDGKQDKRDAILRAIAGGILTEADATQLGKEHGLG